MIYNQIEKNLLRAGFTVRDRGLLNNLMTENMTDYKEIGTRIQTDIIIEILYVDLHVNSFMDATDESGRNMALARTLRLNVQTAEMDCKFIIVEKSVTGAIATLHVVPNIKENAGIYYRKSKNFVQPSKGRTSLGVFFDAKTNGAAVKWPAPEENLLILLRHDVKILQRK